MHEIKIRTGKRRDVPALYQMIRAFSDFQGAGQRMTNTMEQMQQEFKDIHFLVAEKSDHSLVGYLAYFECYHTWSGKGLHMDDLYVLPNYRSLGLGKKMLAKLISIAQSQGYGQIRWAVSRWNNHAIEFYQKMGASISDGELECQITL